MEDAETVNYYIDQDQRLTRLRPVVSVIAYNAESEDVGQYRMPWHF